MIQFLAALAISHQDDMKKRDEFILFFKFFCSWPPDIKDAVGSIYRPGAIHPILQIVLVQNR